MNYFKESKLKRKIFNICVYCGEDEPTCDRCKEFIKNGKRFYCNGRIHLCYKCKKKIQEEKIICHKCKKIVKNIGH